MMQETVEGGSGERKAGVSQTMFSPQYRQIRAGLVACWSGVAFNNVESNHIPQSIQKGCFASSFCKLAYLETEKAEGKPSSPTK